jgi:hypothetical protein
VEPYDFFLRTPERQEAQRLQKQKREEARQRGEERGADDGCEEYELCSDDDEEEDDVEDSTSGSASGGASKPRSSRAKGPPLLMQSGDVITRDYAEKELGAFVLCVYTSRYRSNVTKVEKALQTMIHNGGVPRRLHRYPGMGRKKDDADCDSNLRLVRKVYITMIPMNKIVEKGLLIIA